MFLGLAALLNSEARAVMSGGVLCFVKRWSWHQSVAELINQIADL